jgi:hypothetical protein
VPAYQRSSKTPIRFETQHIYRDTPLADVVLAGLRNRTPSTGMVARFQAIARQDRQPERKTEALLALTALGEAAGDISSAINADQYDHATTAAVRQQLDRTRTMLSDLVVRVGSSLTKLLEGESKFEDVQDVDALLGVFDVIVRYGGGTGTIIHLLPRFPPTEQPRLLAEIWAGWFDSDSEDRVYNLAVVLDASGRLLASSLPVLAASFAMLGETRRPWWLRTGTGVQHIAAIHLAQDEDLLLRTLAGLAALPREFSFVSGWALTQLAPLFKTFPHIFPIAVLVAFTTLDDDAYEVRTSALQALAPDTKSG